MRTNGIQGSVLESATMEGPVLRVRWRTPSGAMIDQRRAYPTLEEAAMDLVRIRDDRPAHAHTTTERVAVARLGVA